jgi:hypothetical protein
VLSGVPSTAWAIATRSDPLEPSRAAGRLLLPRSTSPVRVLLAAALAHGALSLAWTAVLTRLPGGPARSCGYGLAIAALDLGAAHALRGPRFGPVADLAVLPQVADHLAFAVLARNVSATGLTSTGLTATGRARSSAPRGAR